MVKKQTLGSEIYSGTATFGKIRAIIGVIFGTIIGIIMIIIGIYMISKKNKYTEKIKGKVTNYPDCNKHTDKNTTSYECNVNVSYIIDGKTYNLKDKHTDTYIKYTKNKQIDVYYNPKNPSDGSLASDDERRFGWIVLVIGIFVLLGSWISLWFIMHYKFMAALYGATGAIEMLRDRL